MAKKPDNTIKIVCESDERMWLAFRRDITRKQRERYANATFPDTEAWNEMSEEELVADAQRREATVREVLEQVLVDGVVIFDGKPVRGVKAIFEADPDTITIAGEAFLGSAFSMVVAELRKLGNAKRLS